MKAGVLVIICVPPIIIAVNFKINAVVFVSDNLLRFMNLVKCIPEF